MLIIGHRGSRGTSPENSLAALRAGFKSGADMLEFDIQLTRDKVPVVIHDPNLLRTHRKNFKISDHTLSELHDLELRPAVLMLEHVLDEFYSKILLNIELKATGSADVVIDLLETSYIKRQSDWDNVLISSFSHRLLCRVRERAPKANLALLQSLNPFAFLALHRKINLTAIGFHRLHANYFALEIARRAQIFTYIYTVNRLYTAQKFEQKGVGAIVTDYPAIMVEAFNGDA